MKPYTSTTLERPGLKELIRQMRARRVRRLIVDKVDRLTREGTVAGLLILHDLGPGAKVHIVEDGGIIDADDEFSMMSYMWQLTQARQENERRAARIRDNNRAYAKRGRYHRGNRPPYGWMFAPTRFDAKGKPVEYRLAHDAETYPVRQRILTLYQQGMSFRAIANLLTSEGVPTSSERAQQKHVAKRWHAEVIRKMVSSPLNTRQATSIRHRSEEAEPDARHTKKWKRWIELPLEDQITLPEGTVTPVISEEQATAIARRVSQNKRRRVGDSWRLKGVLSSGLAQCAHCGSTLYIRAMHPDGRNGKYYFYYVCGERERQRSFCPKGVRVRVEELDALVWNKVCALLLGPGRLEALAAQQTALDAGDDQTSRLRTMREQLASVEQKGRKLVTSIAEATADYTRQVLTQELDKLAATRDEMQRQISDCEQGERNQQLHRQVLSNLAFQIERNSNALEVLEIDDPTDRPIIRLILDSLGCLATVARATDRAVQTDVDLNPSRASLHLWFQPLGAADMELDEDGEIDLMSAAFATAPVLPILESSEN